MLTLYDYLPSQNGWKVRVLLGLLKIPHETRIVSIFEGESRTDAFLDLNPAGAVPVLQREDGRTTAESNAILVYLAEGTRFLPADGYERAKVMQWLFFEQYHVEPVIGSLRFWTLTGRLERNQGMVAAKREAGTRALDALDRSLAETAFLSGSSCRSPISRFMRTAIGPRIAVFRSQITRHSRRGWGAYELPSVRTIPCIPTVSMPIPVPEREPPAQIVLTAPAFGPRLRAREV